MPTAASGRTVESPSFCDIVEISRLYERVTAMEFKYGDERVWLEDKDGKTVAEVDFPMQPDGTYTITHTFVDDSLRGGGVAGKIVQAAAEYIRRTGRKASVTCSYAETWAKRHKEFEDIFIK